MPDMIEGKNGGKIHLPIIVKSRSSSDRYGASQTAGQGRKRNIRPAPRNGGNSGIGAGLNLSEYLPELIERARLLLDSLTPGVR